MVPRFLSRREVLLALARYAPAAALLGCGASAASAASAASDAAASADDAGDAGTDGANPVVPAVDSGVPEAARTADILVIGAGIAGLRAAEVLVKAGKKVIVLEGRDRLGGRIVTDRSLGVPLDLGASWIHGVTGNPVAARASVEGIPTVRVDYSAAIFDANGQRRPATDAGRIDRAVKALATGGRDASPAGDESLRIALDRAIAAATYTASQRLEIEMGITSVFEHEYAADASELSANHFDDGADEAGGDALFPSGFDAVVHAVARGLDVRLGHAVTAIDSSRALATVRTNQGDFHASKVIVTVPLGVLKAGAIAFTPALSSAKTTAIRRLGMGALSKTYLQFPSTFWPAEVELIDRIPAASERGQWVESLNASALVNLPVLLMFNAGAFGRSVEAMTAPEVLASASAALRALFPSSFQAPTAVLRSAWSADPFARGAYSFLAVGSSLADRDALAAPQGSLFFAGEACSRDHGATVHGAYTSGEKAAAAILAG